MATAEDPTVYIQYYDTGLLGWRDITSAASHFLTQDGGILQYPMATVDLHDPTYVPPQYSEFRILGDVGNGLDTLFYGRVINRVRLPKKGTKTKLGYRITANGLGWRLDRDTITWDYASEQSQAEPDTLWTFKSMIEDILGLGDSGYATGITLDTDADIILGKVYGNCDYDKTNIREAIRVVAETLGYDGYVYVSGSTIYLSFKKIGTISTNPPITLTDPFIGDPSYVDDIEPVKNYILVHGGIERGWPHDMDRLTERGVGKYSPAIWTALPDVAHCTISDYTYPDQSYAPPYNVMRYSLRAVRALQLSGVSWGTRLHIDLVHPSYYVDTARYEALSHWLKLTGILPIGSYLTYTLTDDVGLKVTWRVSPKITDEDWHQKNLLLPQTADEIRAEGTSLVYDHWLWGQALEHINLDTIAKLDIEASTAAASGSAMFLDWLYFVGAYKINPFQHPTLNPPVAGDLTYGVSVYHHENDKINSFDMAQYEGQRVLDALNPMQKVIACKRLGYTWARPQQCVTVNSSTLGISSEIWRIVNVDREWWSNRKTIASTFKLVPRYAQTPPVFTPEGEITVTDFMAPVGAVGSAPR